MITQHTVEMISLDNKWIIFALLRCNFFIALHTETADCYILRDFWCLFIRDIYLIIFSLQAWWWWGWWWSQLIFLFTYQQVISAGEVANYNKSTKKWMSLHQPEWIKYIINKQEGMRGKTWFLNIKYVSFQLSYCVCVCVCRFRSPMKKINCCAHICTI